MKKQLFIIYDNVAKAAASTILLSEKKEVLLRDIKSSKLPGTMDSDPQDFDILYIGELELENGLITPVEPSKVVNLGALKYETGKQD